MNVRIEQIPLGGESTAAPAKPRVVGVELGQVAVVDEETALAGLSGVQKVIKLFDIRLWDTIRRRAPITDPGVPPEALRRRCVEAFHEYTAILTGRNIDAEDWLCDIVRVTSRKETEKQNIDYMIGTVRHWLRLGKWNMPSQEHDDISDGFEDATGCAPSVEAHSVLFELTAKYGATRVALSIGKFMSGEAPDMSLVYANLLRDYMAASTRTVEETNRHKSGTARAAR